MKIVVLAGGLSPERNVSLSSGAMVSEALREQGHQVALVDLFFGTEGVEGPAEALYDAPVPQAFKRIGRQAPDLAQVRAARRDRSPSAIGPGVPYTGSGCLASAIAMDKDLTKRLVAGQVTTPAWRSVTVTEENLEELARQTRLPVVVKPVDSGSSIGVFIARDGQELRRALEESRKLGGRTVLEEYIQGREIQVAVLEDRALPSIEIIPKEGFYDYENKYQPGAALEVCPAQIPPEWEQRLGEAALAVFRTIGLSVYARADFIVTPDGTPYFLEINTLPGMTPTSLVPQEAAAVGIGYGALCQTIVEASLKARKGGA